MAGQFDDTQPFGIDSGDQNCGLIRCLQHVLRIVLENWNYPPPSGHYQCRMEKWCQQAAKVASITYTSRPPPASIGNGLEQIRRISDASRSTTYGLKCFSECSDLPGRAESSLSLRALSIAKCLPSADAPLGP